MGLMIEISRLLPEGDELLVGEEELPVRIRRASGQVFFFQPSRWNGMILSSRAGKSAGRIGPKILEEIAIAGKTWFDRREVTLGLNADFGVAVVSQFYFLPLFSVRSVLRDLDALELAAVAWSRALDGASLDDGNSFLAPEAPEPHDEQPPPPAETLREIAQVLRKVESPPARVEISSAGDLTLAKPGGFAANVLLEPGRFRFRTELIPPAELGNGELAAQVLADNFWFLGSSGSTILFDPKRRVIAIERLIDWEEPFRLNGLLLAFDIFCDHARAWGRHLASGKAAADPEAGQPGSARISPHHLA